MPSDYGFTGTSSTSRRNQLSDHDMLLDLLMTEKNISHMYNHAILESSNQQIINTFKELQQDEYQNANRLFNAMEDRGWYNQTTGQQTTTRMQKTGIRDRRMTRQPNVNSSYAVRTSATKFGGKLNNEL